jgi:hypothetical protein
VHIKLIFIGLLISDFKTLVLILHEEIINFLLKQSIICNSDVSGFLVLKILECLKLIFCLKIINIIFANIKISVTQ